MLRRLTSTGPASRSASIAAGTDAHAKEEQHRQRQQHHNDQGSDPLLSGRPLAGHPDQDQPDQRSHHGQEDRAAYGR